MKLTAFVIDGQQVDIRPAPMQRDWMDLSPRRFAYRCLPLNIANSHGWEILCPADLTALWSGGPGLGDIDIQCAPGLAPPVASHFGLGILTFHIGCVFRTEPGFDLMVQGPVNRPKDSIAPLSGVVESDWAYQTFTMNWKFTRPDVRVSFARGEPFCHIFPVARGALEAVEPQLRMIQEAPELARQYQQWTQARTRFNDDLKRADSEAAAARWQKDYFAGPSPATGEAAVADHRTRLQLRGFE